MCVLVPATDQNTHSTSKMRFLAGPPGECDLKFTDFVF